MELTQEKLKSTLDYNPVTGIFKWQARRSGVKADLLAGTKQKNGYMAVCIDRKRFYLHRLAWLYITGAWPKEFIDHINEIKFDNRFKNLREANNSQNMCNYNTRKDGTSGYMGAHYYKAYDKYMGQITKNGKKYFLGYFNTPEKAHEAYCKKAKELHGEFANFG